MPDKKHINISKTQNTENRYINSLLFFYDYFYPGYKAGGPIQSLTNLALSLEDTYQVSVITSAYDLHDPKPYTNVQTDQWNEVSIPGSKHPINVYYAGKMLNEATYQKIFKKVNPAVVYFNNIYSAAYFRLPLKVVKNLAAKPKVVICPRGMLQKGALAVKPLKKKLYLTYLRYTGVLNNTYWHATNQEEADDIQKHFPANQGVVVASNIPKPPYVEISFPVKAPGQLKLVYLSLIAEKKNLLLLLQVMQQTENNTTLDIYGPVTDNDYWQQCEALIKQMPGRVQYKGDVKPVNVQQVLSQYHALILLTKGENFGHALYESLSVGRPIITSFFTPWNDLQQNKAGLNADIRDINNCLQQIAFMAALGQEPFNTFCIGASQVATAYYASLNTITHYRQLFTL